MRFNKKAFQKGDSVLAVYPDTTSFYPATIVSGPPRKNANASNSTTPAAAAVVVVNFLDDSDEFGITHDKVVPLDHVMYPPP
jgi:hypothetical protein